MSPSKIEGDVQIVHVGNEGRHLPAHVVVPGVGQVAPGTPKEKVANGGGDSSSISASSCAANRRSGAKDECQSMSEAKAHRPVIRQTFQPFNPSAAASPGAAVFRAATRPAIFAFAQLMHPASPPPS